MINFSQEQYEEFIKCSEDPIYFIENYIHIYNIDDLSFALFKLSKSQRNVIRNYYIEKGIFVTGPRQVGKTVTAAAFLLWYAIFKPHSKISIISPKLEMSKNVLHNLRRMTDRLCLLDKRMGLLLKIKYNMNKIEINGSIIQAVTISQQMNYNAVGTDLLYVDECGYINDNILPELMELCNIRLTLAQNCKILLTTCESINDIENLISNKFYKITM